MLMARIDQIITNALYLQALALENLPLRFRKKAEDNMATTVRQKLEGVLLASGDLSPAVKAKLRAILKNIK